MLALCATATRARRLIAFAASFTPWRNLSGLDTCPDAAIGIAVVTQAAVQWALMLPGGAYRPRLAGPIL